MNKKILTILGVLVLLVVAYFLYQNFHKPDLEVELPNPYENSEITAVAIEGEEGWGYDVLIDGNIYVHQPTIPAVGGNKGFKSENDAKMAAELVIGKIRAGILPPTVTVEELQAIGVI